MVAQIKNDKEAKDRPKAVGELFKKVSPSRIRSQNASAKNESTKRSENPSRPIQQNEKRSGPIKRPNENPTKSIKRSEDVATLRSDRKFKSESAHNVNTPSKDCHLPINVCTPVATNKETNADGQDDIPSLFPSRTPGQDRLNRLRDSLTPNGVHKPNESAQLALSVIQSEFGLVSSSTSENGHPSAAAAAVDEDEPMDWEPCDIFERIENVVCNEFPHPYVVPDTNVFLDELPCIKKTIHKGWYCINPLSACIIFRFYSRNRGHLQRLRAFRCTTRAGSFEESTRRFENFDSSLQCHQIHLQRTQIQNATASG